MDLQEALAFYFGHTAFRSSQEEIIQKVLSGRDTLGVLPTGAGKSLCYQLPALLLPGPTLVISPLIALMKDQLDGLPPSVYPKATLINSSLDMEETQRRLNAIAAGEIQLIYAAPERLRQQGFQHLLRRIGLSMVVVDEAHCVSTWGHDFRPDYLFIRKFLAALAPSEIPPSEETFWQEEPEARKQERPPTLLALTATATPEMQQEIAAQLGRPLETITASAFRPNLRMEVFRCSNVDDKMRRLTTICRETSGAAIIYANSRDRCEKLAEFLNRQGLPAAYYHAGLDSEERRETQERFMLGRVRIMVATVAFGMGVDKSNVRLVVHFSLPSALEAYTQEAGRAGRDGKPSRCVLLYAAADKVNLNRWMRQEEMPLSTVRDVYRALQARLGKGSGPVDGDELRQEIFQEEANVFGSDTKVRVAISLLEKCGLISRHTDAGRDMRIEMLKPPPSARADLETMLEERREHAAHSLAEMVSYAEGGICRHVAIAQHFGQDLEPCGDACDVCLGTVSETVAKPVMPTAEEVPDLGRVILETVLSLPFPLGRTGLAKVLSGAADSIVKVDRCPNYNALPGFTLKALRAYMDQLTEAGLLATDPTDEYHRLTLTRAGRQALQSEGILLPNPNRASVSRKATGSPKTASSPGTIHPEEPISADEDDRFEQLRAWRKIEAQQANVPPYVIFHDAVLRAIARLCPTTTEELATISGIGPRKLELYGAAVLELLNGHTDEQI